MSEQTFRVGFGRADITPTEPVPLAGYGNTSKRISEQVISPLYSTCVAFSDTEDNTVLLFHNDLIASFATYIRPIREAIAEATGVPAERVLVSATHSHSVPDLINLEQPSIPRYKEQLKDWMVQAACAAMEDRKPARIFAGSAVTKRMNFVRHYLMDDGTVAGSNFGEMQGKRFVGHTSEADPLLQVVKFLREGGKDVLLVNFQAHPLRTSGLKKTDVSADIVGALREALEAQTDGLVAYFTGGSGNINPSSRIEEENPVNDYLEHGQALAGYALEAIRQAVPVKAGAVRCIGQVYPCEVNHTEDHKVEEAKFIRQLFRDTNDPAYCRRTAEKYGLHSAYHAMAVLRKLEMPKTMDVEMYAFCVGDVAFVTAPYEMFDVNGKQIRDGSPFKTTFIATCANDAVGYIPSALGYFHGCYGVDNGNFHPGAGEELVAEYVKMLGSIYN